MLLVAQAAADIDWQKLLTDKGPLWTVFGLVVWFVVYYGPKLIQGHLDTMNCFRESSQENSKFQGRQTLALESLTQTARAHENDCKKTHRMVGHLAEAGKIALPQGVTSTDAHRHLDKVIAIRDGDE